MAIKSVELEMLARGEGCLGKAADDEPVFILRAQDLLSVRTVLFWAMELGMASSSADSNAKAKEAFDWVVKAKEWQAANRVKVPD